MSARRLGSSERKRERARARETREGCPLVCLLARPCFLVPTASKRLLRRLSLTLGEKGFARVNGRLNTSSSVSLGLSVLSILIISKHGF